MELTGRIGRSGSAELFRGRLKGPSGFYRTALIKRLRPDLVRDQRQIDRLRTEAILTARVIHPNVLGVLDTLLVDGELMVAHEDHKITDLQRLLEICATQRRRLPARLILGIGWLIADALAVAHAAVDPDLGIVGIAHGDLSPSNILINGSGRILVADFGIGLHPQPGGQRLNKLGRLHGKPGYMSPELVVRGVIGPRSDFFALGTLLWEMLTLRRLFSGKDSSETLRNVALAQVDERFARHTEIPPFVQDVLKKALRRQPDERYVDARELQEVLVQAHPQGFFGIEAELAHYVNELAPIPGDEPLELESAATSRPRGRSRVASRMILHVPDEAAASAEAAAAVARDEWQVEPDEPEVIETFDSTSVPPLDLEPPPLPPPPFGTSSLSTATPPLDEEDIALLLPPLPPLPPLPKD